LPSSAAQLGQKIGEKILLYKNHSPQAQHAQAAAIRYRLRSLARPLLPLPRAGALGDGDGDDDAAGIPGVLPLFRLELTNPPAHCGQLFMNARSQSRSPSHSWRSSRLVSDSASRSLADSKNSTCSSASSGNRASAPRPPFRSCTIMLY
jgi:hypothetical protein